jgi:hypothetical protein
VWWYTPKIIALGSLRQEDINWRIYVVRSCLKKKKKKKKKRKKERKKDAEYR